MTSIAPSSLEYPAARGTPASPTVSWSAGSRAYFTVLAFVCFYPYPALSLGGRTGLQASQLMTLALVPALLTQPPNRALYAFVLLAAPRICSAFFGVMRPHAPEIEVIPKELISWLIAVSPLLAASRLSRIGAFPTVLTCLSVAVLGHCTLGLYQFYSFSRDEFPFLFLYRNPSFKAMESWSDVYAMYIKRPCGLFPEPSALAAAIAPWLVLLAGILADSNASARLLPGAISRRLAWAATLGGFALLSISRSGLGPIALVATFVAVLVASRERLRALTPGTIAAAIAGTSVFGAGLYYFATSTGENMEARIESSWGIRTLSVVTGLTANTEPLDLMFGVGPGQSTEIVRHILAGVPLSKDQDDIAIWSLSVTYYMESGLFAACAMATLLTMILRAQFRSSARALGLAALGVWTVGVTITTSYPHLSSIWLFLGVLLEWDEIFPLRTSTP